MFYNTFFLNTLLVISFYYDLILERERMKINKKQVVNNVHQNLNNFYRDFVLVIVDNAHVFVKYFFC